MTDNGGRFSALAGAGLSFRTVYLDGGIGR